MEPSILTSEPPAIAMQKLPRAAIALREHTATASATRDPRFDGSSTISLGPCAGFGPGGDCSVRISISRTRAFAGRSTSSLPTACFSASPMPAASSQSRALIFAQQGDGGLPERNPLDLSKVTVQRRFQTFPG